MSAIMRLGRAAFVGAALAGASPAMAQDDTYMGIDLTTPATPPESEPRRRTVGADMEALLEEGVEVGCLAFTPPATYAQTDDAADECREFIARLAEASAPEAEAGSDEVSSPVSAAAFPLARLPLVTVARMAYNQDKRAQFELGMRFEEGRGGVEADWTKARALYRQAGRATPAKKGFARVPDGDGGTKLAVGVASPRIAGIPEARERLEMLELKMEREGG